MEKRNSTVDYCKRRTKIHEDSVVEPSKPYHKFLKGRVLSGSSSQTFDTAWIFQRFVNRTMQCVVSLTEKNRSWYQTDVEGGRLYHEWNPAVVVFAFSILSPLLFPMVYGGAVVVLVVFAPISIPYILKVKVYEAKEAVKPIDIFVAICKSVWYFAAGVFSWFYVFWPTSTFTCAIDYTCKDVPYHIAPVLVYSMFISFMFAGFRYAREITASACDCACDRQKKILLSHGRYGNALTSIVDKLSEKNDQLSYYPIFVKTEEDEVVLRLPWKTEAALIACAGIHALLPVAWMAVWHHQPFVSLNVDYMTAAMLFFGTVAPFVEIRHFLQHFLMSLEEFQHCTDQLLIVQYIASSRAGKDSTILKRSFTEVVRRNDEYRMRHHESEEVVKYVALLEGEHRFEESHDPTLSEVSRERHLEGRRDADSLAHTKDELENLREFQVAFNFRRVEGIFLFRFMRKFLMIDILNERLEVEQFANLSIVIVFVGMFTVFMLYLEKQGTNCTWIMIPYDCTVLFVFLVRTINICIEANEYLFKENEKALLGWIDHCTEWDSPESEFEFPSEQAFSFEPGAMGITCDDDGFVQNVSDGQAHAKGIKRGHQIVNVGSETFSKDSLNRAETGESAYEVTVKVRDLKSTRSPAIAWIWNTLEGQAEPVKFLDEKKWEKRDKSYVNDIHKALDSMLQSQILDSKQQLLGFDITTELRARLVAPFGTFITVYIARAGPVILSDWRGRHVFDTVKAVHNLE